MTETITRVLAHVQPTGILIGNISGLHGIMESGSVRIRATPALPRGCRVLFDYPKGQAPRSLLLDQTTVLVGQLETTSAGQTVWSIVHLGTFRLRAPGGPLVQTWDVFQSDHLVIDLARMDDPLPTDTRILLVHEE